MIGKVENMDDLSRKVPLSAAVVVVVVLGGVVAGALVFADDGGGAGSAALAQLAPERMELNGRWRGIELAGVTSPAARELGVPPAPDGVAVTQLPEGDPTVQRAGLMRGDVLTGIDGADVLDLTDLFDATRELDPTRPVPIDIIRQGQPLTLVLPPSAVGPGLQTLGITGPQGVPPAGAPDPLDRDVRFTCPQDGTSWLGQQVAPEFRCFRCGGPLVRAR